MGCLRGEHSLARVWRGPGFLNDLLPMPAAHHQKAFSLFHITFNSVVVFSSVKSVWKVEKALLGASPVPEGSHEFAEDRLNV